MEATSLPKPIVYCLRLFWVRWQLLVFNAKVRKKIRRLQLILLDLDRNHGGCQLTLCRRDQIMEMVCLCLRKSTESGSWWLPGKQVPFGFSSSGAVELLSLSSGTHSISLWVKWDRIAPAWNLSFPLCLCLYSCSLKSQVSSSLVKSPDQIPLQVPFFSFCLPHMTKKLKQGHFQFRACQLAYNRLAVIAQHKI